MYDLNKAYSYLGVDESCSDTELRNAYAGLKVKYQEQRFAPGEEGNAAAKNLTDLEEAYSAVVAARRDAKSEEAFGSAFAIVEQKIREGKYDEAQAMLDGMSDRSAEWHYQQSIIFYKRNWYLESKKQLQLAINRDPDNARYKDALSKLENIMSNPNADPGSFKGQNVGAGVGGNQESCGNSLPSCCTALCIMNCCCDCMRCCL